MEIQGRLNFENGLMMSGDCLGKSFESIILDTKAYIYFPKYERDLNQNRKLSCPNNLNERLLQSDVDNYLDWGDINSWHSITKEIFCVHVLSLGLILDITSIENKEFKILLYQEINRILETIIKIETITCKRFHISRFIRENGHENENIYFSFWGEKRREEYFKELFPNGIITVINDRTLPYNLFVEYFDIISNGKRLNSIYETLYRAVYYLKQEDYSLVASYMYTCLELFIDSIIEEFLSQYHDDKTCKVIIDSLYNYSNKKKFINNCQKFTEKIPEFEFIKQRHLSAHKNSPIKATTVSKEIHVLYGLIEKYAIPMLVEKN